MFKWIKVVTITLSLLFLSAGTLSAQGESGADCLIIPPSARASGMGLSFSALSDDATAIWWNPGGLAFVNLAMDLMHSQLVPDLASDVFYEYLGGAYRLEGIGTLGFALVYLTYGEWVVTGEDSPEPIGTAQSWEVAPTISGAIKIMESIGVGMNLKFIYVSLAPEWATRDRLPGKGHSVAVDLGVLWKIRKFKLFGIHEEQLNLGLSITNLGPSVVFIDENQAAPLPRNLRLGVAYTLVFKDFGRLTLVTDFNRPLVEFDRSNTYHMGGEFVYIDLIAVRGGYMHDHDGNIMDPTYGLGFIFNNRYRIDWASVPQSRELGRVHRWSVGITF
ncbi:MAG: PorV/PorQ family protein [bacterium]|nr:MAG: PorV/PorQ family protein [bacterium]